MRFLFLLSSLFFLSTCQSQINLKERPIGLINKISFFDTEYNVPVAANGFLVRFEKRTYAITAKHLLVMAKTPKMQFVDFEGELKEWKMHPKNDSTQFVILDKLLNSNRTDSLTWSFMNTHWDTYNDWLIFSIKENEWNHPPLEFRKKPLTAGEKLFIVGWTYNDEEGEQRVYEFKYGKTDGDYHEIIQVKAPENLGGLSGAPVVDEKGEVVGLVTSGWTDEKTNQTIVAATSSKNILQFLSSIK